MAAASASSSGSSISPRIMAASKGVWGSMVSGYTDTWFAPRATASRMLSAKDSALCPGMPHIRSTDTFSKRSWAARTAARAASASWARPRMRSTSSSKDCTPRESRFTPSAQISRTMGAVRLSGFASIVHSTSGSRCIDIDSA